MTEHKHEYIIEPIFVSDVRSTNIYLEKATDFKTDKGEMKWGIMTKKRGRKTKKEQNSGKKEREQRKEEEEDDGDDDDGGERGKEKKGEEFSLLLIRGQACFSGE